MGIQYDRSHRLFPFLPIFVAIVALDLASAVQLRRTTSDDSVMSRDAQGRGEPILGHAELGARPVSQTVPRDIVIASSNRDRAASFQALAESERRSSNLKTM
jgi:hypothetical protein